MDWGKFFTLFCLPFQTAYYLIAMAANICYAVILWFIFGGIAYFGVYGFVSLIELETGLDLSILVDIALVTLWFPCWLITLAA